MGPGEDGEERTGDKVGEVTTTFGVSGYLTNSDVLIWDRASQSLWSQVDGRAIAGPRAGQRLEWLPAVNTTWKDWVTRHPDTEVLKGPKPVAQYAGKAYGSYPESDRLMFPVANASDAMRKKAIVTGARLDGIDVCWSHDVLAERANARPEEEREKPLVFRETYGLSEYELRFEPTASTLEVFARGKGGTRVEVPVMRLYWFAWYAFFPETVIATAEKPDGEKPDGEKPDGEKAEGEKAEREKAGADASIPAKTPPTPPK